MSELTEDQAAAARAAETAELIAKALDPTDDYDGHHGNDRSEK